MGATKQNKSHRKVKTARRTRRIMRKNAHDRLDENLDKIVPAICTLHSCGVDVFASGIASDPRMNLTLGDIELMYPWLADIGKVFR